MVHIEQNVPVCPKQASFWNPLDSCNWKVKENVVWGSACFGREPTNCHENTTSQESSIASFFKLHYRFCVHQSGLKMKTKGCFKTSNPTKGKENKIPCNCSLQFSQNLWSMADNFWMLGSVGQNSLWTDSNWVHTELTQKPRTKNKGVVGASGCCCLMWTRGFLHLELSPPLLSQFQPPVVFQQNQTIHYVKRQWHDAASPSHPAGITLLVIPFLQPSAEYFQGRDLSQQGGEVA